MSRAILAMLCACVVMIATKGVTQVVLAFNAGGSSQVRFPHVQSCRVQTTT